jgi:hypothetical protein
MSSPPGPPPPLTKIEKVRLQLAELANPEKEEKPRQKLCYLQFFVDFKVEPAPASFSCSRW